MLSLKTHNVLDYAIGVVLLFIPVIFGFSAIDAARNSFLFAGFALIAYSLLTRYDYALWRVIPVGTHMGLDVLDGVFLMLAPWIFGYRDLLTPGQEVLHYVLALGVFGFVALTRTYRDTGTSDIGSSIDYPRSTVDRDRRVG
jgi:hypothetical protein